MSVTIEAFGAWDGLSREKGAYRDVDDARGYYARGLHPAADLTQAIRDQWSDDAPAPADVHRGFLRHVPYAAREQHPQLGLLSYRGTRLVPAQQAGPGAFAATYWIGNDPR